LCSGLGGWTEAFVQHGWTVVRIENNPALQYVPFTIELDVLEWENWISDLPTPNVIVASPPCREFSNAYAAPGPTARRTGETFTPDLALVRACLDIIDYIKPKYWILENVQGSQPYFLPLIGGKRQNIGPFYLWGNFPLLSMPPHFKHKKEDQDTWSDNPLRANLKAMIPFELSFVLYQTLSRQTGLERWM
jgi:hypothetical protein